MNIWALIPILYHNDSLEAVFGPIDLDQACAGQIRIF